MFLLISFVWTTMAQHVLLISLVWTTPGAPEGTVDWAALSPRPPPPSLLAGVKPTPAGMEVGRAPSPRALPPPVAVAVACWTEDGPTLSLRAPPRRPLLLPDAPSTLLTLVSVAAARDGDEDGPGLSLRACPRTPPPAASRIKGWGRVGLSEMWLLYND